MSGRKVPLQADLEPERLLPQNIEAERAVLGSILIHPEAITKVADILRADDFYVNSHRAIYQAIIDLYESREPADLITLTDELQRRGKLEEIGGVSYVSSLANQVPTSANAEYYAGIVLRAAIQRRLIDAAGQIAKAAQEGTDDLRGLVTYITDYLQVAVEGAEDDVAPVEAPDATQRPPFPTDALPGPFQRLVREAAAAMDCEPDLVGVPLLCAIATSIGAHYTLQVKPGYYEPPVLWAAMVARPGEGKTPAMGVALTWIRARQDELYREHQLAHQIWEESEGNDVDGDGKADPEPILRQIYVQDTTQEALFAALKHNPRGMLMPRDELSGWVRGMDQYKTGKGSERQRWMEMWSAEAVTINRRTWRQPLYLPRPVVSIVGGIQPDMLSELSDERGREDGFIHRILFAYPQPRRLGNWSTAVVAQATLDTVRTAFIKLWALPDATGALEAEIPVPTTATFTPEGAAAWETWVNAHRSELNNADFADSLRGPWLKFQSYAARLALILHLGRWACGDDVSPTFVDAHSMDCATKLIAYFKSHARAVYARLHTPPEEMQFAELAAWIRRQPGQTTTVREVQRAKVAKLSKSTEIKWFFAEMAERSWGDMTEVSGTGKRGRKTVRFTMRQQERTHQDGGHSTFDNNGSGQAGSAA
jgi:hypothetical protein